ncbi:MAG TPA: YceI family protein [Syntrophorhabdaceae bacterium]|nr:YceI family protein [Syntrophorhabdaceae bacterium]
MAKYVLDPDHTAAQFRVRHMMVTWVRGQLGKVQGTLDFDPRNMSALSVTAEIDAAGIYTGVEKRDADLRSSNYLDVQTYPVIRFKSTSVEASALDRCLIHGELTLHGVTRLVTLDTSLAGPSRFQDDDRLYTTFGFKAVTRINREDFGMMTNMEIENGGFMVGRHVYLSIDSEADLVEG